MGKFEAFDPSLTHAADHSDASQALQDNVMMLRVADKRPDQRSEARRMYERAADQFDAAKDKPAAMKTLGPKFEAAVSQADKQSAAVEAGAKKEFERLKPAINSAADRRQKEEMQVRDIINKVADPKERDHLRVKSDFYMTLDPKSPQARNMRGDFDKYPGLLPHLDSMKEASVRLDKTLAQLDPWSDKAEAARLDQIISRTTYANALEVVGDRPRAEAYRQRALDLLNGISGHGEGESGRQQEQDGYQRIPNAEPWPKPGLIRT